MTDSSSDSSFHSKIQDWTENEYNFMSKALSLSLKGRYSTHPNPMVGCVIIRNGRIIGQGYHKAFGEAHAERAAISSVYDKSLLNGSDLYITLEPCTHHAKQPPCVDLLLKYKWRRLYIATLDCDERVCGKGLKLLKEAGYEIRLGLLQDKAREINKVFFTYKEKGRPYITLKAAISLNGYIAWDDGFSRWLSSDKSLIEAHKLRALSDAILVGRETIERDNPELTTRLFKGRSPLRIILDPKGVLSVDYKVFSSTTPKSILVTGEEDKDKREAVSMHGHEMWVMANDNGFALTDLLGKLAEIEISHLLVEGGGRTIGSFIKQGLYDRLILFLTPVILPSGRGFARWEEDVNLHIKRDLKLISCKRIDRDLLLEYIPLTR